MIKGLHIALVAKADRWARPHKVPVTIRATGAHEQRIRMQDVGDHRDLDGLRVALMPGRSRGVVPVGTCVGGRVISDVVVDDVCGIADTQVPLRSTRTPTTIVIVVVKDVVDNCII